MRAVVRKVIGKLFGIRAYFTPIPSFPLIEFFHDNTGKTERNPPIYTRVGLNQNLFDSHPIVVGKW
jgi:hypothetical protein